MEEKAIERFDQARVNRFNVILIGTLSTVLSIEGFVTSGLLYGFRVLVVTYSAFFSALFTLFLNRKKLLPLTFTGIAICIIPVLAGLTLTVLKGGQSSPRIFMVLMAPPAMVALYFREKMLLVLGFFVNVIIILAYLYSPVGVLGANASVRELLARLIILNCGSVIIYFLTKWGNEYIKFAMAKEDQAKSLLGKLENTLAKIEESVRILTENIVTSNQSLHAIKESSAMITKSTQEMANGVMTEANSVNDVSRMMDTIKASISETQEYSDQIKAVSTAINQVVANSSREIDEMSEQMQTINAAVSAPLWSMLQNYRREWKISPTFYAEYPK